MVDYFNLLALTSVCTMTIGGVALILRRSALSAAAGKRRVSAALAAKSATGAKSSREESIVVEGKNEIEKKLSAEIMEMHDKAVRAGEDTYVDPATGFTVFTRAAHLKKKRCCGCHCRHCPYGHVNVRNKRVEKTEVEEKSNQETVAEENAPRSVVYTKGGDKGKSSLFTGERREKTDCVFEALGVIDELSSHIGLARAMLRDMAKEASGEVKLAEYLEDIQQELMNVGTIVATPLANSSDEAMKTILEKYTFPDKTKEMEKIIDTIDSRLVPLRVFILPGGGNAASAQLHVCRTTCRRGERRMVEVRDTYGEQYTDHLRQATVYVNRLSDFLFVAARSVAEEDIVRK